MWVKVGWVRNGWVKSTLTGSELVVTEYQETKPPFLIGGPMDTRAT